MAHIELLVIDRDSPNLRESCERNKITYVANPTDANRLDFFGSKESLEVLIYDMFDSEIPGDAEYLISLIEE